MSFGMSELYEKVSDDPEESGWGIEFSIRVARGPQDEAPPTWSAVLLQQLARYVFAVLEQHVRVRHAALVRSATDVAHLLPARAGRAGGDPRLADLVA
ncbi:suppressor of fused domain protein [Nonomuraea insulae]|uniref:Suppressor of fused domain protein n=1 Tax=Nonomuraea insulae TaxID=1616787 RepID=A0ABW1D7W9_9ACTN